MPRVTLVTGYIELDQPWRRHNAYVAHGNQLMASGLPMVAFLDRNTSGLVVPSNVVEEPASLEECWLYPHTRNARVPEVARPGKDTVARSVVVHQKTEWLIRAAALTDAAVFAWVDFGILQLSAKSPGMVNVNVIVDWYSKVLEVAHNYIEMPGYHKFTRDTQIPCGNNEMWYTFGGITIIPVGLVEWLDARCKEFVLNHLQQTGAVGIDSKTLANVVQRYPEKFLRWQATFPTIFTAYDAAALTRFC